MLRTTFLPKRMTRFVSEDVSRMHTGLLLAFGCLVYISTQVGRCEGNPLADLGSKKKTIIDGTSDYSANAPLSQDVPGLRVLLRADRLEYRSGGPVFVDFRLLNTGDRTVYVYNELEREGWLVFFQIRSVADQEAVYQSKPVRVLTRRKRDSLYAVLAPGGTVGRFYQLSNPESPFPPGEYEVWAGYTNTYETCLASLHFDDEEIKALGPKAYVRLWTGQIVGQPVRIRVEEGPKQKRVRKRDKKKKPSSLFRWKRDTSSDSPK